MPSTSTGRRRNALRHSVRERYPRGSSPIAGVRGCARPCHRSSSRPPEDDTLRPLHRECVLRSLTDQPALELRERREHRRHHLARGVEVSTPRSSAIRFQPRLRPAPSAPRSPGASARACRAWRRPIQQPCPPRSPLGPVGAESRMSGCLGVLRDAMARPTGYRKRRDFARSCSGPDSSPELHPGSRPVSRRTREQGWGRRRTRLGPPARPSFSDRPNSTGTTGTSLCFSGSPRTDRGHAEGQPA